MKTETKEMQKLIEFRQLQGLLGYVANYLPEVAGMEKTLDIKQLEQLVDRYGFDAVKSQLEKMENFRGLHKYRSAYLTCMKWFEMDIKKGYFTPPDTEAAKPDPAILVKEFLTKHPVGSEINLKNGNTLTVEDEVFLRSKINNGVVSIADFIKKQRSHQI